MLRLILRRLAAVIPILIIVTFGVFLLVQLVPTDPAQAIAGGITATPKDVEKVRQELNLDDPVLVQYGRWLGNAVQGDLGTSYIRKTKVTDELSSRLPVTVSLIVAAVIFAMLVAVPLGILSGLRPNGGTDQSSRVLATVSISIPNFLMALILVIVFAVKLKILPPSGYAKFNTDPLDWLNYILLPAIALGAAISAAMMRQLRSALIDELDTNHIRTQWAIGGASPRVVGRHGLRNASGPAITILGMQIAALVGGAVIIEQIFSLPGIGTYMLGAIIQADIPVIQGCVLLLVLIQVIMALVVDIVCALLNPKLRMAT